MERLALRALGLFFYGVWLLSLWQTVIEDGQYHAVLTGMFGWFATFGLVYAVTPERWWRRRSK